MEAENSRVVHLSNHSNKSLKEKELEEYLEILWYLQERHGANMKKFFSDINGYWNPTISDTLKEKGFIEENDTEYKFTEKGYNHARQLVRSHRLAERLLIDVLDMKIDRAETNACEFEHVVVPEIVDGICTLLGHPKICPHGLPIPEGQCCIEAKNSIQSATKNLSQIDAGSKVRVAYINTRSNSRMHQLTQLGIHPGVQLWLHQTYPTLVIRIEHNQIALTEEVAKDILVWEQS